MKKWAGKLVVGLGGSAGTGKDDVQKMLERLQAFTIDADEIANRVILKGAPGYQPIVENFGETILDQGGQIDRSRLYQFVRSDRLARDKLQSIIDPLIKQATVSLLQRAKQSVVFIKATNLSRFGLLELCDQVWVITAPEEVQVSNLARKKGWSAEQAQGYIQKQPEIDVQLAHADVVLYNKGSRGVLWRQVTQAWGKLGEGDIPEQKPSVDAGAGTGSALSRLPAQTRDVDTPPVPLSRIPDIQTASVPSTEGEKGRLSGLSVRELRLIGRRIFNVLSTLLVIAYLTSWGLILAERGRERLPAQPLQAAWQALVRVGDYLVNHPQTYYWHKDNVATLQVVFETLKASAGLLLLSMGLALAIGLPLGIAAALAKRKTSSALVMLISVLGVSTPSFLFAMFLWVVNIWVHRTFDIQVLPSAGFGWDAHLVMPTIVLAMRPLAQIAQVTYVSMRDILGQDYIRTAYSKGLNWRLVRNVHALPNILIPTLTTLGSSLRYSLASLPVVEVFFYWPGVGLMLLDAIQQGNAALVTDLILSLGLFFLFVNLVIEFSFPLIDPRLRGDADTEEKGDQGTFLGWIQEVGNTLSAWARDLRQRFTARTSDLPPLPNGLNLLPVDKEQPGAERRRWLLRNFLSNPAFILGSVLLVALLVGVLFGEQFASTSPYQAHGVMTINGKIGAPPYEPSSVFPWGTDHIGRDIQALVLAGGKRTLTLAFFGMLARLLLGATLGILAGWQRDGWFDRLVTGAVGVWAAFPVTLFAMILIQALGIQQGMWVFIVAISVVGWGEVAQFVRGQVITLKPQLFIESARSVGSRPDQILVRHIIPNLVNSLIVLAALEMGGVLMLLAELGYLNIFMGGGFRAMIGEAGRMMPVIATYSDVPEWAALIANVRQYWRSYPWMALYPGLAVFLTIMTFNLFGEGLRRFLDDTYSNLSRLFNRYTLIGAVGLAVVVALVLQSSVPLNVYRPEGLKFDEKRVMQDIENLSSPQMQGRETGMPGATMAAIYIAYRMSEIGIFPAGEHNTYLQHLVQPRIHLFETPTLTILDESGRPLKQLTYKRDFTEFARSAGMYGDEQAPIMGVAYGPTLDPSLNDEYGLSNSAAMDHIVIVHAEDIEKVNPQQLKGILVIADESLSLDHREVYPYNVLVFGPPGSQNRTVKPYMLISPEVADSLLKTASSSLAELDALRETLEPGQMRLTAEGARVSLSLQPRRADDYLDEKYINVMGVIPGQGHFMGMEEQVIIVSAYYDGLGTDLTGTVYPGANDNASGVAMMLELARLMKESVYQPDKTVLFVAWAGGERQEGLSVVNVLNARPGASELTVETVIELSGVGYGTGSSINLGNDSSYRLVKLFQEAAGRYNLPTTTRGRNPHYGLPLPTAFGGRDAMTLSISWDGSDSLAHTPKDIAAIIDPAKLYDIGRTTYLTLLVLSRETEY
ncbi:MAG: dephospho-CoA kinase [Anaerolineales bacterium]|nr:dephospho-CoA kinase [Anaerolineales bacterium]